MAESARSESRQQHAAHPRPDEAQRALRTRLAALRAGTTSFAVLAGLSCFVFLTQWGVGSLLAAGVGLVFALLVRVATTSLAREWLLHAARQRQAQGAAPPAPRRKRKGV